MTPYFERCSSTGLIVKCQLLIVNSGRVLTQSFVGIRKTELLARF